MLIALAHNYPYHRLGKFLNYEIFQKELKLTASFINPYTFDRAIEVLALGKVKVDEIITDIVPLAEIHKVFEDASFRRRGKVLIKIK